MATCGAFNSATFGRPGDSETPEIVKDILLGLTIMNSAYLLLRRFCIWAFCDSERESVWTAVSQSPLSVYAPELYVSFAHEWTEQRSDLPKSASEECGPAAIVPSPIDNAGDP